MVNKPFTLVCIIFITIVLIMPVTRAEPANSRYYSNSFDSPSSLNDGYWQANDTTVIDGKLQIYGEASFSPQLGDYSSNNFTVQFDVYHDVKYANNTAYSGPFYQLCDSQNRTIILLGYFQVETNGETHCEGCFENLMNYHHYYFPYNHTSDWSTWRLTGYVQQMTEDGLYWGNFTIQIDNETITSFRSDSIIPEGTVHNITNEEVKPIAYFNIYPLPQTGVMIIPTTSTNNGIHYSSLSHKVIPTQYVPAIPSYIDNFLYGYADAVPMSQTTPSTTTNTPAPTSSPTLTTNPTNIAAPTPTPSPIPEFPHISVLILIIGLAVIITAVLKFKPKN